MFHRPQLWTQIRSVINGVNAATYKTKVSKEKTKFGKLLYAPRELNKAAKAAFKIHGWKGLQTSYWVTKEASLIRKTLNMKAAEQKAEIIAAGHAPIRSYNQTDFVKDRVAIELQLAKYSFVAYDLFVKHLAFLVTDKIDLGVEIIPMKQLQAEMSSGPGYYEGELYNLIREGRGVPGVPLILIRVAP
jgi:hypothetical protein